MNKKQKGFKKQKKEKEKPVIKRDSETYDYQSDDPLEEAWRKEKRDG